MHEWAAGMMARARGAIAELCPGPSPRLVPALAALFAACAAAPPTPPAPEAPPPPAAAPVRVIGLEAPPPAARLDAATLARQLAPLGIRAARTRCADARWGDMQPARHAPIDFRALDARVGFLAEAGFRALWICLETDNAWGAPGGAGRARAGSPPPQVEALGDFADFVAALVERYDGDGIDDMPSLRATLRVLQIGGRNPLGSTGALGAYLDTLARAREAAHAASPGMLVTHAAWSSVAVARAFAPEAETAPDAMALDERVSALRLVDFERILDRPDAFDALHLDGLADAVELERALIGLHGELERLGAHLPILVSQVVPTPLVGFGPATRCEAPSYAMGAVLLPAREEDRCRLADWFRALLEGRPEAVAWAHERAASDLVKKVLVASEQGVAWISVGSIEDAALWQQPALEAAAGLSAWGGLLDAAAGGVRPGFVALQQLMRSGADWAEVARIPVEPDEARVYALEGAAWVAWYDPPRVALPGDPILRRILSLSLPTSRVRVETLGAVPPPAAPAAQVLDGEQGAVRLELTARPILLAPEP